MIRHLSVALFAAIVLLATENSASATDTNPKNILPNASFELGLGHGLPTNWADGFNPLTIKLTATGQYPKSLPTIEKAADAVDGRLVAGLVLSREKDGFRGHLTSPAVPIEPGRAYVLSAYARSDTPSAKLQLSLWTRPMDWREKPDAQSAALSLTKEWKRYEFSFTVATHAKIGVVDLAALADTAGKVQLDAIQLEAGPEATAFMTRFPVEASLFAKGKPFRGSLQYADKPVTIDLDLYNSTTQTQDAGLELCIHDLDDKLVATRALSGGVPSGYSERKVSVDLDLIGDFNATCQDRGRTRVDVGEYRFIVHPVMAENMQGVLVSVDGKVSQLPAERVDLPWKNSRDWYAEPAHRLVVGSDDNIYVFACDGKILRTPDGGRTWDSYEIGRGFAGGTASPGEMPSAEVRLPMYAISALRDGSFMTMAADSEKKGLIVTRSKDRGKTWETIGEIPNVVNGQVGSILELENDNLIFPVGYPVDGCPHSVFAYHSKDRGKTWKPYPISPGGEPYVDKLKSGRLLAVIRHNVEAPPGLWNLYIENEKYWKLWIRSLKVPRLTSYKKNLILLDSHDGGITWQNAREATHSLGEMHGMTIELPDGRIALFYVHRMPYTRGGERVKISRDGGNTWDKQLYYLNTTRDYPVPGYPGYSANCVLPPHLADGKPGMILSIVAERAYAGREARMQAVRWRPLPK